MSGLARFVAVTLSLGLVVVTPVGAQSDGRTLFEMGNADAVLDGELDGFIRAALLANRESEERGVSAS